MDSPLEVFEQFMEKINVPFKFEDLHSMPRDASEVKFKLTVEGMTFEGRGICDVQAMDNCIKQYLMRRFNLKNPEIFNTIQNVKDRSDLRDLPDGVRKIIEQYQARAFMLRPERFLKLSRSLEFKYPYSATMEEFRKACNNDPFFRAPADQNTYMLLRKILSEMKLEMKEKTVRVSAATKSSRERSHVSLVLNVEIPCSASAIDASEEMARYKASVDLLSAVYVGSFEVTEKMKKLAEQCDSVL